MYARIPMMEEYHEPLTPWVSDFYLLAAGPTILDPPYLIFARSPEVVCSSGHLGRHSHLWRCFYPECNFAIRTKI